MKKLLLILFLFIPVLCFAQKSIEINGRVRDASTNAPLFYTNVYLKKQKTGTFTDTLGVFHLKADIDKNDTLEISLIGYEPLVIIVKPTTTKLYNLMLKPSSILLSSVTISAKKEKYSKKNNPAVEFMEQALEKKNQNRLTKNDYYSYNQHQIMQIAINNFSDSIGFLNRILRFFDFSAKYIDLSDLNGKPVLPFFISENVYNCYYNKSKDQLKTVQQADKTIEVHRMLDMKGFETLVKQVFDKIDIYEPSISIFGNEFMSPFTSGALSYYKFFINDTVLLGSDSCVQLTFYPFNVADFGFSGSLYFVKDTASLALKKAELRLPPKSGVNWIDELYILQEYEYKEGNWCLKTDEAVADMSAIAEKIFSAHFRRSNTYNSYHFKNTQNLDSTFWQTDSIAAKKAKPYVSANIDTLRIRPLRKLEQNTYDMYEELKHSFKFKFMTNFAMALMTGYVPAGKVDIGAWNSLVSFNDIEGTRVRLGLKSNTLLSKQWFFNSYAAYGFGDEELKYQVGVSYSFNKKKWFMREYPTDLLSVTYQHDNKIPGDANTQVDNDYDKFWLSFRTSPLTKMTSDKLFIVTYEKDFPVGLSGSLSFLNVTEKALGNMNFNTATQERDNFSSSQFSLNLSYSKNKNFFETGHKRNTFKDGNPTYTLNYQLGIKDFFNSDYTFHKLEVGISKRTFLSSFGFFDILVGAGKIWNPVPYPLLFIPQGSSSFLMLSEDYNLMSVMEFITDEYAKLHVTYRGSGYIFNRIPLINKLNWRGVVTCKTIWGHLNSYNLPQNNADLMLFPTDLKTFGNMPYVEASIGIYNIFNILQIDFLKRFTYLENVDMPWGIKASIHFGF